MIWPAIDLLGGRAVRLHKGRRETAELVGDPLEIAARWALAGQAHVVDLDAAFDGQPRQDALIARIAATVPIQVGGGVRSLDDIQRKLDLGALRVVVGTAAFEGDFLENALERFGAERVVVAADVAEGRIAVRGWTDTAKLSADEAGRSLVARGARHALVTAVHRDGTLEGPDLAVLDVFHHAGLQVLASGGIGSLADLTATRKYAGTIVGKALYAGRFTLAEALCSRCG